MISSDKEREQASVAANDVLMSEQDLLQDGWTRCFIADEPRLSEAVQTYQELGFEVMLLPVPPDDSGCTECMQQDPERFRLIYTRKRQDALDFEI